MMFIHIPTFRFISGLTKDLLHDEWKNIQWYFGQHGFREAFGTHQEMEVVSY